MGADELLGPGSWRLNMGVPRWRGVRVPPSLNPSVTLSRGICSRAGALAEPMLAGMSARLMPAAKLGLPRVPLVGSSGQASDRGCSSAFGVSCLVGSA